MTELPAAFQDVKILGLVALSMVLGAVIGFNRELAHKPAGLRTHMLVAGAATLLVILGRFVASSFDGRIDGATMRVDPTRVIEAVVTGVSFLGAGTIIRRGAGETVSGLTTAASLLFAAAVGIGVAADRLTLSVGVTALAVLTLAGVSRLSARFARRWRRAAPREPPS